MDRNQLMTDYHRILTVINSIKSSLQFEPCINMIETFAKKNYRNSSTTLLVEDLYFVFQIQRERYSIITSTTTEFYEKEISSTLS